MSLPRLAFAGLVTALFLGRGLLKSPEAANVSQDGHKQNILMPTIEQGDRLSNIVRYAATIVFALLNPAQPEDAVALDNDLYETWDTWVRSTVSPSALIQALSIASSFESSPEL